MYWKLREFSVWMGVKATMAANSELVLSGCLHAEFDWVIEMKILLQNSFLTEFWSLQFMFFFSKKILPTNLSAGPETKNVQTLSAIFSSYGIYYMPWFCHKIMSMGKSNQRYRLVKIHRCFATGQLLVVARHSVLVSARRQLTPCTFRLSNKCLDISSVLVFLSFCSLQQIIWMLNRTGNQSSI